MQKLITLIVKGAGDIDQMEPIAELINDGWRIQQFQVFPYKMEITEVVLTDRHETRKVTAAKYVILLEK